MKITNLLSFAALLYSTTTVHIDSAYAYEGISGGFVQNNIRFASAQNLAQASDDNIVPVSFQSCDGSDSSCDGSELSCDSLCGDGSCDSGFGRGDLGLLGFGIIKKSDACFNDFISPMTNPVFFEDPRTLTEARFVFINHNLPNALGGNSVQVYALQLRAALTERLSIIATKDGFVHTQSSLPILDSGFADLTAGLKYNLYRDARAGRLLSVGGTYEIPLGSERALQGNGDGLFHFFTSGATRIGERAHWISAVGLLQPADEAAENRMMYWSNHLDSRIGRSNVYAFTEVNWYNYLSSANAFPLSVEGGDLFNFGAPGVTGNDLVTQAGGFKWKPRSNVETGVAYEVPLTEREGILANRFTADLIFRY